MFRKIRFLMIANSGSRTRPGTYEILQSTNRIPSAFPFQKFRLFDHARLPHFLQPDFAFLCHFSGSGVQVDNLPNWWARIMEHPFHMD
jgi:hypothetical protein